MGLASSVYPSRLHTRRHAISLLAPLLDRPALARWVIGVGIVHLALTQANLVGLRCTVHELTGLPCPGCGLTGACLHLLHGEWRSALALHPFAPVFLLAMAAVLLGAILPAKPRRNLAARIAYAETHHGLAVWLAGTLLVYWIFRLIFP